MKKMANEIDGKPENAFRYTKGLLRLGYACNNRCGFCNNLTSDRRGPDLPTEQAMARIDAVAKSGMEMVVFSGGEPSLRKDLFDLMKYASGIGLKNGVITNGRMFSYADFTERAVENGLEYAFVSLHGHTPETHNMLTGQESFDQTVSGIANLSRHPVCLAVNTVLTNVNSGALTGIYRFLSDVGAYRYKVSLPEPKGSALENFNLIFHPNDAAAAVMNFIEKISGTTGPEFGFDGFTPCLLDNFLSLNDDFFTHGFRMVYEAHEGEPAIPDSGDRRYAPTCLRCSMYHLCPGVYSGYMEHFPGIRLSPLHKPISNSIRFDLIDEVPADSECGKSRCKQMPDSMRLHPERSLIVKKERKLLLYSTDEKETGISELRFLKHELQQVYECCGSPSAGIDFEKRLKKLRLSSECSGCQEISACPGIFVLHGKNVFKQAIGNIRSFIKKLSGRVLEVGCGNAPYINDIRNGIRDKRITHYTGIDPELTENLAGQKSKSMEFHRCRLEDFVWNEPPFDAVIFLRSYHHLEDIDIAFRNLRAVTAKGTSFFITDDLKHIQAFDSAETAPSHAPPPFDHFRCHGPADAALLLEEFGFRVESITGVSPNTATNWFLRAERID